MTFEPMEDDIIEIHGIVERVVEPADLRTHLRNNLIVEFQQELHSKAALTADQRQALSDLVTNNLVTSPRSARRGRRNYFVGRFPRITKHSC